MTQLDVRTVLFGGVVVVTVSALAIRYLWHQHRRQANGLGYWLAAFLVQWFAVAVIALRGTIPETVSILLGSPLVVGGVMLLCVGLQRYSGQCGPQGFNILVFAAVVAAQAYLALVRPSLQGRHVLLSLALLAICARCAWVTLRASGPEERAGTRFIGFIFLAFCLVSLIRIVVDVSVPPGAEFFASPGVYTGVVLLAYQGLFLGLAFGLFVMVSQRLRMSLEEDVRARRDAESALRASRETLQAAVDASPLAIIVLDTHGNVTLWNEAAQRTFGWSASEACGRPNPIVPIHKAEEATGVRSAILDGKTFVGYETERLRKDGSLIPVSFTATAFREAEGRPAGILSIVADLTPQKRLEAERVQLEAQLRQQQKLEALGTLAGGVAHEINNPIAGIMNYAQLIADTVPAGHPAATHAQEIVQESLRVATIVRNLLQFARQEKQHPSPARLADIVEQTLSLVRATLRRDQIALTVDVPADLPALKCRSQQIQQVLMNLLTNARDALNAKDPGYHPDKTLTVTARVLDGTGPSNRQSPIGNRQSSAWLRLTVADRGTGIPAEVQDRIFDPFFTTKPRDQGTGLGLAISHGIVKDHGGRLTFETTPGKGTAFHVTLPANREEA